MRIAGTALQRAEWMLGQRLAPVHYCFGLGLRHARPVTIHHRLVFPAFDDAPIDLRSQASVKRRADVVGIFPNEGAIAHLVGAVLLELNDEWQLQHRYIQTGAMAELTPNMIDQLPPQIATLAA